MDAAWAPLVDGASPEVDAPGPWFEALRGLKPEDVVAVVWGELRDLRPWAAQGVLTLPSAVRWRPFVDAFLRRLCAARDPGMHAPRAGGTTRVHFVFGADTPAACVDTARHHGHAGMPRVRIAVGEYFSCRPSLGVLRDDRDERDDDRL